MLDMTKLPEYIKIHVVDEQNHAAAHAKRATEDAIRIGYEYGRSEEAEKLATELKLYLPGNGWVQMLIDKLEDPDR